MKLFGKYLNALIILLVCSISVFGFSSRESLSNSFSSIEEFSDQHYESLPKNGFDSSERDLVFEEVEEEESREENDKNFDFLEDQALFDFEGCSFLCSQKQRTLFTFNNHSRRLKTPYFLLFQNFRL